MLAACGAAQNNVHDVPAPAAADAGAQSGDLPDPADRCPVIPTGCPGSEDVDGCPDVSLTLGSPCELAGRNADTLADVAREMKREKRLTALRIVASEQDCAAQVKKRLVDAGVAASRIETRVTSRRAASQDLYFEVTAWDGKRCSDGG